MPRGYDRPLNILWAVARTIRKYGNGSGSQRRYRGSSDLRVGRAVFWDPLVAWRDKKLGREQATLEIARRYRELVDLFDAANTLQAVSFDQAPSS